MYKNSEYKNYGKAKGIKTNKANNKKGKQIKRHQQNE